jgi:hypothetical protein
LRFPVNGSSWEGSKWQLAIGKMGKWQLANSNCKTNGKSFNHRGRRGTPRKAKPQDIFNHKGHRKTAIGK